MPGIPDRYRPSVIPHVIVDGAAGAIEFYRAAFGAEELMRIARPDGMIHHAELRIGGSTLMLGDAHGEFLAPVAAGGTTVLLHVYVEDVDALYDRAVAAGASSIHPPTDQFYGDRSAMLKDPFGHVWVLLTHLEDLPPAEIARRGSELLGGHSG